MTSPREIVIEEVRRLSKRPPVHIAALAHAYASRTGHSIKDDFAGGMLRFVKAQLADDVVLLGEGNDTFVRMATPAIRAASWMRACVDANGPILVSMLGRLYLEAHGKHFAEDGFPGGIGRFLRTELKDELSFEAMKGQEVLVDLKRRGDARSFLSHKSTKRKQPSDGDGTEADVAGPALAGRLGARGCCAAAYSEVDERILIVGEADFSWSASLLTTGGGGNAAVPERRRRLTTTSFDALVTLQGKYGAAAIESHVGALKRAGASVLHEVDATSLGSLPALQLRGPFDLIVFHFPHCGTDHGLHASIADNRALLRGFLEEVARPEVLAADGEVHLTLVHRYPYTAWLSGLVGLSGRSGGSAQLGQRTPGADGAQAGEAQAGEAQASEALKVAKAASSAAAKAAKAAKDAADAASTPSELAAAVKAKDEARAQARAAAKAVALLSKASGVVCGRATLLDDLVYCGAVPFDFAAFPGYRHQATTRVDQGALDVATGCLTHVWRRTSATVGQAQSTADSAERSMTPLAEVGPPPAPSCAPPAKKAKRTKQQRREQEKQQQEQQQQGQPQTREVELLRTAQRAQAAGAVPIVAVDGLSASDIARAPSQAAMAEQSEEAEVAERRRLKKEKQRCSKKMGTVRVAETDGH